MILIRADGRAEPASGWFRRLQPGDVVTLAADGPRGPVRAFRRCGEGTQAALVEVGASEAAMRRALHIHEPRPARTEGP